MQIPTLLVLLLVAVACLLAGLAAGVLLGLRAARAGRDGSSYDGAATQVTAALERRAADEAVVRESLERLHDQMRDLEHARASWQGQLHEQVSDMRRSTDSLRRETLALSTALRKPQVRGRWGELHLRRAVELAGLVDRCDFSEQVRLDDGALRPDLVVHLAGGRSVVVDAKVPLDAHLDALATDDEQERAAHLQRHARQLRTHVDRLGSKSYWAALDATPEFVVLFVPAEACLSAALDAAPDLLEHAASRQVVLASPTTLIALLRTVAHGWTQAALSEEAARIHRLGRELHGRLVRFGTHLDKVGRGLNAAVTGYNAAVGSYESRVLVQARRFGEVGLTEEELERPRAVTLRAVSAGTDDEEPEADRSSG